MSSIDIYQPFTIVFRMPRRAKTHKENLKKVCAVCANLVGRKADRGVSEEDARLIVVHTNNKNFVKGSNVLPQGIHNSCRMALLHKENGRPYKLRLPDNFDCEVIPEEIPGSRCTCRWCKLARLSGPAYSAWQKVIRELYEGAEEDGSASQEAGGALQEAEAQVQPNPLFAMLVVHYFLYNPSRFVVNLFLNIESKYRRPET